MGRRKLLPSQRRTRRYTVQLTDDTATRLQRAIERAGYVTASEWLYDAARKMAARAGAK